MELRDLKRYKGYMPVKMEREDTLVWLGKLIGEGWIDELWMGKYGRYHEVRYRFGDVQEAQLYLKDKTWLGMPIGVWLKFMDRNEAALDDDCLEWIRNERRRVGIRTYGGKAKGNGGGILDI